MPNSDTCQYEDKSGQRKTEGEREREGGREGGRGGGEGDRERESKSQTFPTSLNLRHTH